MSTEIAGSEAFVRAEAVLASRFAGLLGAVSLKEIVEWIKPGVPDRVLDDYKLVAVQCRPNDTRPSLRPRLHDCIVADGVRTHYYPNDGNFLERTPPLDTGFGIGLAYRDQRLRDWWLVAVCAAGVQETPNEQPRLLIRQTQGMVHRSQPELYPGLSGPFSWRQALMDAWEYIAPALKITEIATFSAAYHPDAQGKSAAARERFVQNYDKPAARLGYNPDANGYLVKKLS